MQTTLAQRMKPDAVERKHGVDEQHLEWRLRVLSNGTMKWTDYNVGAIGYISELLFDLSNGRCTIEEISEEVQRFETVLINQRNQLVEAANVAD